jgi:DNA-binding transcriptional MerR regulator
MEYFTTKDMESLCDIKAHTLRKWEQRYRFFVTEKNKSQHRIYDNENLKQLLRISFLYHNGWKISKIAGLTTDQIMEEVCNFEINSTTYKSFIIQMIEAAIDFNEEAFIGIIDALIEKIGFEKCITDVCYPFLKRIGMLRTRNNIMPAQQHFSNCIIQNRIIAETEKLKTGNNIPALVLFSPGGEYHELPLPFIYYLLRKNGWSVVYLGVNINKEIIKQFIGNDQIEYLFLHLISNFTGWMQMCILKNYVNLFPAKKLLVRAQPCINYKESLQT